MKQVRNTFLTGFIYFQSLATGFGQQTSPCYLQRSIDLNSFSDTQISWNKSNYKALFGLGDADAKMVKGVKRFGLWSVAPGDKGQVADYAREELVYYVMEGSGVLSVGREQTPLKKDDFFYIPIDTRHSFTANPQEALHLLVMGYPVPKNVMVQPSSVQIANAGEVEFQTLEQLNHGTTSRFQLLLGTTESKRDRLSAASQVNSLFVIDFDHGGTNVPHQHEKEEEIYLVLQGTGEMVAGETTGGNPLRVPVEAGDVFFFSRNCLVGFYSNTKEGTPHARILAVRSKYPQ